MKDYKKIKLGLNEEVIGDKLYISRLRESGIWI